MDRRSFLSWVGVGWIASCLPIAIAACSQQTETPPASKPLSPPRSDGFQAVTTVADLEKSGYVLVKDFPGGAILVARDPGNRSIAVVNPTCTHQGCVVNWKVDEKRFACPCHDAEFAADGKVLEGPATSPLKTFTAKIEGDTVLVKA
jgi:cytochrome b6-f complex iron-sulfur subunit